MGGEFSAPSEPRGGPANGGPGVLGQEGTAGALRATKSSTEPLNSIAEDRTNDGEGAREDRDEEPVQRNAGIALEEERHEDGSEALNLVRDRDLDELPLLDVSVEENQNRKEAHSRAEVPISPTILVAQYAEKAEKRRSRGFNFKMKRNSMSMSSSGVEDTGKKRKRRIIGGRYAVVQFLGRGAQGTVLKCQDKTRREFVAIKSIQGGSLVARSAALKERRGRRQGLNKAMQQVSREIALLKKIEHENIVKLLHVIDEASDEHIHLVFEFVSGGPLRQLSDSLLLNRSGLPLPEDEARDYFRQLCAAIRFLHFHGILHRDIKPSNLIIDREKRTLKLTDLGIAVQTKQSKANKILGNDDDLLAGSVITGTPAFLPPEFFRAKQEEEECQERLCEMASSDGAQFLDDSAFESPPRRFIPGRAADIWAAGVTLFAFIFGSLPYMHTPRQGRFFSGSLKRPHVLSSLSGSRSDEISKSSSGKEFSSKEGDRKVYHGFSGSLDIVSPVKSLVSGRPKPELTQADIQERILINSLRFPGTGLGTSLKLRNLLSRMLEKNPDARATIYEVCGNDWLCTYEPMPPLSGAQRAPLEPSEADRAAAIMRRKESVWRSLQRNMRSIRSKAHIFGSSIRAERSRPGKDTDHFEDADDELFEL